jgi:transcription elongation factor GreA
MLKKIPITAEGYATLEEELKNLKTVERPEVIKAIAEAREHGDLKENAEYAAAREKQSFVEGRIKELEAVIAHAEIIDIAALHGSEHIKFGATVVIVDEETDEEITYQIVGEHEADIRKNKLAITAPIARALIGKSVGESVEVQAPSGLRYYEILEIHYRKAS